MKVGDIIHCGPVDRDALAHAMRLRGLTARVVASGCQNARSRLARKIQGEMADAKHRSLDPYELAATFLRRRGYVVYDRGVLEKPQPGFQVGRKVVDDRAGVIAYAVSLGHEA